MAPGSAVASQRWRWNLSSASDRPSSQRSSMSAFMDSRPFVVFSDRPSTPYTPRRCNVSVSSRPSARLPAADWFRSSSSCWSDWRAARASCTPDGCRRAGDAAATPAAHAWPGNSPRSRACAIDTVAPGRRWRKACRTAARSPLPPSTITRSPWETEAPLDQGPEERGQHLLVLGVRLDKAQEPFCSPSS